MKHEILYRPSYSLLKIGLEQGESVSAEAGAMVSMSSKIMIQTRSADAFLSWLIPQLPKQGGK